MYIHIEWIASYDPVTGDIEMAGGDYPIKGLNFSAQTDLTGNSMPVNTYTVDVITTDQIPELVDTCQLYDDRNRIWARWPLSHAQRISGGCTRVTASSWLKDLEYRELAGRMFTGVLSETAIAECFGGTSGYTLAQALTGIPVYGYAPAQNARERLTWLLFVLGGYVSDVFRNDILIGKVDTSNTLIPYRATFMRPTVDTTDWVTGLKITTYTFRQAASEAEWQADDSSYIFPLPWIATEQVIEITNPDAPDWAPANVVEIDGIYLINGNNVSDIANRLAGYWFNPTQAQLDCINNRAYKPGDLVTAFVGEEQLITGYIQQASFAFGLQARSTLKLIGVESVTGARLTVNYTYMGGRIGQAVYYLPVGMDYSISNPYIDRTHEGRRYVYRPQDDAVTGTIVSGENVATQPYDLVLEYADEYLTVYAVDAIERQNNEGVIA